MLRRARRLVVVPGRLAESAWDRFVAWFNALDLSENAVLLGFAVAVGTVGALGVIAFYKLIDLAWLAFFAWPSRWLPPEAPYLARPILAAGAMVAAWWVMRRLAPGEEGMTVPDIQRRVVRAGGRVPPRPAVARTVASAITIGGGGSVGAEGPVAVLGAAVGSNLARVFRFGKDRTTLLVAAGAAAAISAAFNAPLAGAFFALEEIIGGLAVSAFPVVVVASVVAAVISRAVFGNHPVFPLPEEYSYRHAAEVLAAYPLLGLAIGGLAALFIAIYFRLGRAEVSWRRAASGGVLVGLMVAASGGALVGRGHLAIPLDTFASLAWWVLALFAVGKIVATALSLGWGGSGGVFTPALYAGAAGGAAFGAGLAALMPNAGIQPAAYALVGMGAMVAAATGAPITGILIVFELTDDSAIMLPLMIATAIAVVTARRLSPDTLYSGWLRRRGITLEHGLDRDVLAGLTVADALDRDATVVAADTPVASLVEAHAWADQTVFPVVDAQRRLLGILTARTLGRAARDATLAARSAEELCEPTEAVTLEVNLREVVRRLGVLGLAALPVVDAPTGRVLGTIGRGGVLGRYGRTVEREEGLGK
ncbi:MAG TPA: chloride channel protein [Gemmatimonadales bacterium]|nr:chloride channel protein [Gemmatimonadales bacterium]